MDCVRSHYANHLNAPEFCSALQRRLTLSPATNKLTHQQPVNDPFILHNFYREDHSMMEKKMKYINGSISSELSSIAVSKQRYSVYLHHSGHDLRGRSFDCCGKCHSPYVIGKGGDRGGSCFLLHSVDWNPEMAAIGAEEGGDCTQKTQTDNRVYDCGAENGVYYVNIIEKMARRLDLVSEKMSEAAYDGKKVAAVENRFKQLQWKVEEYGDGMKWVKQSVIESIIKTKVG